MAFNIAKTLDFQLKQLALLNLIANKNIKHRAP